MLGGGVVGMFGMGGGNGGQCKMGQMASHCLVGRQGDAEAVSDSAERPLTLQPWSPAHNPTQLQQRRQKKRKEEVLSH